MRASAVAVVAWLCVAPVFAGPTYEIDRNFEVTLDGQPIEGAKVFRGTRTGSLLLLVPSESKRFLVDAQAGTVFALREEDVVVAANGATAKVRERFAWSVPLARDRDSSRFLLGPSEVAITRVEPKPAAPDADGANPAAAAAPMPAPTAAAPAPAPPTASERRSGSSRARAGSGDAKGAAEGKSARECVSLQTKPATAVPGCTRFVFLRNTCDAPVVAQLQRTEHLMTGTLPQVFTEMVPAESELALGCSWWSGAMAPAQHEIVGASFGR
ncbi:MAG TPA: hypothetical protein VFQ07_06975 [Candidatus Polarisedimenticolia bacterium]|nr:hypothetical protein [Candidatus Polarisedimenticolia bacterium]